MSDVDGGEIDESSPAFYPNTLSDYFPSRKYSNRRFFMPRKCIFIQMDEYVCIHVDC